MIWVFGDSYAEDAKWAQIISNNLDMPVTCLGLGGSSIDYTYKTFNDYRNQIKNEDIVIVATTHLSRRWFFKDQPRETTFFYYLYDTNECSEKFKYYINYLTNNDVYNTYLINFLYNIEYLTKQLNLHTILLPCFDDTDNFFKNIPQETPLNIAHGDFYKISLNEFDPKFLNSYSIHQYIQQELRLNHMIKTNHTILANKIIDNIKIKKPIDLTTGFVTNVLNAKTLKDIDFSKQELFDVHLNDAFWNYHSF